MADGKDTAVKVKPLISKESTQKITPKPYSGKRFLGVSAFPGANRQFGSEKEVLAMPRMPKYRKEEWAFFLDERGRKKYNELCRKMRKELQAEDAINELLIRFTR